MFGVEFLAQKMLGEREDLGGFLRFWGQRVMDIDNDDLIFLRLLILDSLDFAIN